MNQHNGAVVKQEDSVQFEQWCFQQTVEIEHEKQKLDNTKTEIERTKKTLERQKRDFARQRDTELERMKKQQNLFDMKWQILENELQRLAEDKRQLEKQKSFYSHVSDYESNSHIQSSRNVVKGDLFFMGVGNEKSLKKRYKDLIKIYHPDNLDGDTCTIQEINREYNTLRQRLECN